MQKFPRRWDKLTQVNYLQRKIILNSIAYYELNTNMLTDKIYDETSQQLVEFQKSVDVSKSQYDYVFYDFDGTTGFDLFHRLNAHDKEYLYNIACHVCGNVRKTEHKKVKKKRGGLF